MNISFLDKEKIKDISHEMLLRNGKIKLFSYKDYEKYTWEDFRYFCHKEARYGIPTIELIEYIKSVINGRSAIEIGSGHGDLGYHLGIPMTDSKKQARQEIRFLYEKMGQPVIKYPEDVEKLDALEAVKKYKPQVVVASWVTPYSPKEVEYSSSPYGIKEDEILPLIDTYILVGNLEIHEGRPILTKNNHQEIKMPFIKTRSSSPEKNRIFIINRQKGYE